jgi:hypothetical protein
MQSGPDWRNSDIYYTRRGTDGVWSQPVNISKTTDNQSIQPVILSDPQGNIHVLWFTEINDFGAVSWKIFYARRSSDGKWSLPVDISGEHGECQPPSIAVTTDGTLHIVYEADKQIYYQHRDPSGLWSAPQILNTADRGAVGSVMAAGENGFIYAVWSGYTSVTGDLSLFYAYRDSQGAWSAPENILPNAEGAPYALVVDGQSTLHLLWGNSINHSMNYIQRSVDGIWQSSVSITDLFNNPGSNSILWGNSGLRASEDGTIHLLVIGSRTGEYTSTYYFRRSVEGVWSQPVKKSNNPDGAVNGTPEFVIDASGNLHAAWNYGYVWTRVAVATGTPQGIWSPPLDLTSSNSEMNYNVALAVDIDGNPHVAWTNGDLTISSSLKYAGPAPAENSGSSTLSQQVILPADIASPGLSFLYQLNGASTSAGTHLNVQISQGNSITTLLTTSAFTDGWDHTWFDLSPWTGQAITLTFNLNQVQGKPNDWAYLDEVSVGSTFTDIKAGGPALVTASPGNQINLELTYTNPSRVAADDVLASLNLPDGLSLISSSIPVTITGSTLQWNLGSLSAGSPIGSILLTLLLSPDAPGGQVTHLDYALSTSTPELELMNNQMQLQLKTGYWIYLPNLTK